MLHYVLCNDTDKTCYEICVETAGFTFFGVCQCLLAAKGFQFPVETKRSKAGLFFTNIVDKV